MTPCSPTHLQVYVGHHHDSHRLRCLHLAVDAFNHTTSGKSQSSERLALSTLDAYTKTGCTLPRPTPPRWNQALPQPGAPRHPEDPDPLKPAHCEHFPSKQTSPARHHTPDRGDTCLTRVRDSKVRSYPLCKSSETPTFKDTMVRSTSPVSGVSHRKPQARVRQSGRRCQLRAHHGQPERQSPKVLH